MTKFCLYFFGALPNPATNLQFLIEELNYNSILVDSIIVTLLLWILYIIVLIGYYSKIHVDDINFWQITENIFIFGVKFSKMKENKILEFIWTVVPGIIILLMMLPSIIATYMAEIAESHLTPMKIIGNQWFWTSEHTVLVKSENLKHFPLIDATRFTKEFSLTIKAQHLPKETLDSVFLLVNEKPIILPIFHRIPFVVTSNDVIHSFALPECGIKIDAIVGRLNQVFAEFVKVGKYAGMCSELCGVGHAKMPINVTTTSINGYKEYLKL